MDNIIDNQEAAVLNANEAQQVAWIVYINGIEVPALSVSISYGVWQIPEAEVTMVPDAELQRLGAEDRVSVQVFYCDYWQNPAKPEFRLCFDGEIVAWSYVNVARQRAVSFSCVDYIQIFSQLFFFFMSSVNDIAIGTSGEQIGVSINGVNTAGFKTLYPYSLFSKGLLGQGSPDTELINRPIDFVYNVVRGMIQADVPNRAIPAANFFTPWTRRTKFHRRFVSLPFLEDPEIDENGEPVAGVFPILRAVRASFAMSAVAKLTESVGSSGSIWQMLQQVLQTLMMEVNMLPTPSATVSTFDSLQAQGPAVFPAVTHQNVFLSNYFVKPQFFFGLPPSCNVFFPSQIRQLAYEENYATQPTRMYFNDEALMSFLNTDNSTESGLGQMMRDALVVAHPEEAHLAARAATESPAGDHGKNILIYPEEFYRGPVVDRRALPRWFMFLLDAQKGEGTDSDSDTRNVSGVDPGRDLYRKYAQYEYFKERYARRVGGISLAFNPYPVPGFPCAAFDRRATQVDIMGYIMSVRQNLSSRAWSTQVSYSYGRTMREMFSLMNRQFTFESETHEAKYADIQNKVKEGKEEELAKGAESVGAIAVAPAEPIAGIRDVIQNFQRAEAFYRSLFFRAPAPEADVISERQLRAETERRSAQDFSVEQIEEGEVTPEQVDADLQTDTAEASRIEAPPVGGIEQTQTRITGDLNNKKASFWYHEIIEFVRADGSREGIKLEGIDTKSKSDLLTILAKMKKGKATEEELRFAQFAVNRPTLGQPEEGQEAPGLVQELNSIEVAVRTASVSHNVDGSKRIAPREGASELFRTYDAAMRYNARPICTLEEYIYFLAEDGAREGRVEPGEALANNDPRSFPAHYYLRIRNYRPGPPEEVPTTDITNTSAISSVDGTETAETETDGTGPTGLADDFPQNRADWNSVLLEYRRKVLEALPPRT